MSVSVKGAAGAAAGDAETSEDTTDVPTALVAETV